MQHTAAKATFALNSGERLRQSYFSDLAVGVVAGFGTDSYRYALQAALARL